MDTLVEKIFAQKKESIRKAAEVDCQKARATAAANHSLFHSAFPQKMYDVYYTKAMEIWRAFADSIHEVEEIEHTSIVLKDEAEFKMDAQNIISDTCIWINTSISNQLKPLGLSPTLVGRFNGNDFQQSATAEIDILIEKARRHSKVNNEIPQTTNEAFVIMRIGDPALDHIWEEVFKPVIKDCGLEPKRIDKDNEGRTLINEITKFIERSKIVIADLTYERPNCYLEVGFALGKDKFKSLVICVREDHHPDSPNYKRGGYKVHFDISGYDIIFWDPTKIDIFKADLKSKILQRMKGLE